MEMACNLKKVGPTFLNCVVVSWKNHLKLAIVWCLFKIHLISSLCGERDILCMNKSNKLYY